MLILVRVLQEHLILEEQDGGGFDNHNSVGAIYGINGDSNGRNGGYGRGYRTVSSWASRQAGGGAGNPGGNGGQNGIGNLASAKGEDGTGGLLIIYTNNLNSPGKIESNGSGVPTIYIDGGKSGGGSINIFYKNSISIEESLIQVEGGKEVDVEAITGGIGGNGTISIGSVSNGTYISYAELKKKIY